VLALPLAALALLFVPTEPRLQRRHQAVVSPLDVPSDPDSVARGRQLAHVVAQCAQCHGDDLGGRLAADDPLLGRLYAPNLTSGLGGIDARDDVARLVRSIRHGVDRNGRALLIMPAQYLRNMTDRDLGALVAYLRTVPPVDRVTPSRNVGLLTRLAMIAGWAPDLLPAEQIDQRTAAARARSEGEEASQGSYLVDLGACRVCHHPDLSGGLHPLAVSGEPVPSDLTRAGPLASWSDGDFIRTLRTGVTPVGRPLDPRFMPWPRYAGMTDRELRAIWRYLRRIPGEA
jgi:mono/diheme cytochrome c family protein